MKKIISYTRPIEDGTIVGGVYSFDRNKYCVAFGTVNLADYDDGFVRFCVDNAYGRDAQVDAASAATALLDNDVWAFIDRAYTNVNNATARLSELAGVPASQFRYITPSPAGATAAN